MANPYKGFDLGEEPHSAPGGRNHLLVIAIDEYAHCPKLYNCVKDAREFIEVLTARYQFEPENTITLFNAEATRPNIHTQLKKLKSQVSPDDNLVIYFSGHGETEGKVGYWVPVNAHPGHEWEYFSTDEIKRRLDAIDSFHTFAVVDACFSGSLFTSYIAAILEFLEKYPDGNNVQRAIRRIEQLEAEDQAAWEMAEKGNSLGSYLKYIHRWEEGRYLEDARKKVEELRAGNKGKAQKIIPTSVISSPNTFTDPRDGQTYHTVELNGLRWMAQNLNYDVGEGCWLYDNEPKNGEKYGRLAWRRAGRHHNSIFTSQAHSLQLPRTAHPVQVAIHVQLEQIPGLVGRPPRFFRHYVVEAQLL